MRGIWRSSCVFVRARPWLFDTVVNGFCQVFDLGRGLVDGADSERKETGMMSRVKEK